MYKLNIICIKLTANFLNAKTTYNLVYPKKKIQNLNKIYSISDIILVYFRRKVVVFMSKP